VDSKIEVRYTAVGSVVGTWTNVATVTFTGGQPKNDSVPVIVVSHRAQHTVCISCMLCNICTAPCAVECFVVILVCHFHLVSLMHTTVVLLTPKTLLRIIGPHPLRPNPSLTAATILQTQPTRDPVGSCCRSDWGCSSNVAEADCDGTWSASNTACSSRMFCSGACCTGANTATAMCRVAKKAECQGSLFSMNSWSADGDCNNPSFCPKVRRLLHAAAKRRRGLCRHRCSLQWPTGSPA
jgi:hypothetical protein